MRNPPVASFGIRDRDGRRVWHVRKLRSRHSDSEIANINSPQRILGEAGWVLMVVLGIVLAINMVLTAVHIG